ncbi:hypothetical protein [Paraburkholderia caribensis]|uniref:hypothetical protein n=1 Tax=Paraburkholderia caribensis TaxID=75105 RepID=UPI0031DD8C63
MKRQEGELGKCHARDYSGNAGNVQLGALRAGLFGVWSGGFGFWGFCCVSGMERDAPFAFLGFALASAVSGFALASAVSGFALASAVSGFALASTVSGFALASTVSGFAMASTVSGFAMASTVSGFALASANC